MLTTEQEAQIKRDAWAKVEALGAQILTVLEDAHEGFMVQASVLRLVEQAQVQQRKWMLPEGMSMDEICGKGIDLQEGK